ncbi:restriction endonuclease subunit S [Priestia megaterium]|uniref:restriction endonuclease subunit S n=1 Tax=Priestia megaterium TaxID=1404 RepID=UPI00339B0DED
MRDKTSPKIRFPGFSEEWKQMKLGEVVEIKDSARISNTLWVSKGVPYLRSSDLANDEIVGELFISDETYQSYKDKTGAPQKDDVLFTSGGKIGVTYHKTDDNPVYVQGGSILYAKTSTSNKLNGIYLNAFFSSPTMTKYIEGASTGLTIKHFTLKPANAAPIFISSLKEQNKIGEFFKQIDETIAFHQQELTILKQTKEGFLQKMFPKEGESVPEVRFPGFTGSWEERKLKELAEFSKGNGYSKSDLTDKGKPVILYGRLYTRYETVIESVDTFTIEKEKSVISKGNEVIIPSSGETSKDISRASVVSKPGVILGGDLNIIRPSNGIDPVFLALTISNGRQQKELSKRAQGKSIVHLHNSDLKEINLIFPGKEEQIKIGNLFNGFDRAIALHQRELDTLKETKKAFLQKMFA